MADKNEQEASAEVRHSADGHFVHYGFVHQGAFHPVASERIADYEERVQAAKDEEEEG